MDNDDDDDHNDDGGCSQVRLADRRVLRSPVLCFGGEGKHIIIPYITHFGLRSSLYTDHRNKTQKKIIL